MDRALRPSRLEVSASSPTAEKEFKHWFATFKHYLSALPQDGLDKLVVLINFVSPDVFEYISDCESFEDASKKLSEVYVKPKNEIYARHVLATRHQKADESLDEYLQALRVLCKDCNFRNVDAVTYANEAVRDVFIAGIRSSTIRQRLLENRTLDLDTMFDQARALESAFKSSESYMSVPSRNLSSGDDMIASVVSEESANPSAVLNAVGTVDKKCWNCGNDKHAKSKCPARNIECFNCGKVGHFAKCCKSGKANATSASVGHPVLATVAPSASLKQSIVSIGICGHSVKALIDSGSSESFIHPDVVRNLSLAAVKSDLKVSMAAANQSAKVSGHCLVDITVGDRVYSGFKLSVLEHLCCEVILGLDFQSLHERVTFSYGGKEAPFEVCGLVSALVEPPELFANLDRDCKPIAAKSRRYTSQDKKFIGDEVERLLKEDVIEKSNSPWRAQVVVTSGNTGKKRMVIDYSETVNMHTNLDAYPLPRLDDTVHKVGQYRVFSTIDLKSAYHQIPIRESDKPLTAFEANSKLYQFKRIPFGVTNGVACFQRAMDNMIESDGLKDTFAYLDNIFVCGMDQNEHDVNLQKFFDSAKRRKITFNAEKCVFSVRELQTMGHVIGPDGQVRPDPERLRPLKKLPYPSDGKSMKRALGLFSYYSKWIQKFSDKIKPLSQCQQFPLGDDEKMAFDNLKLDVEAAVINVVDENAPFELETDASGTALSGVLNQHGRPVGFFSRTLNGPELNHPAVEKEAAAIIESVRHWRHYLLGRHFSLITDQRAVRFVFDQKMHIVAQRKTSCFAGDLNSLVLTSILFIDLVQRTLFLMH